MFCFFNLKKLIIFIQALRGLHILWLSNNYTRLLLLVHIYQYFPFCFSFPFFELLRPCVTILPSLERRLHLLCPLLHPSFDTRVFLSRRSYLVSASGKGGKGRGEWGEERWKLPGVWEELWEGVRVCLKRPEYCQGNGVRWKTTQYKKFPKVMLSRV